MSTELAVRRLAGFHGIARFELAEAASGESITSIWPAPPAGALEVLVLPAGAETALARPAAAVRRSGRFAVDSHRVELIGRCAACGLTACAVLSQALCSQDGIGCDAARRGTARSLSADMTPAAPLVKQRPAHSRRRSGHLLLRAMTARLADQLAAGPGRRLPGSALAPAQPQSPQTAGAQQQSGDAYPPQGLGQGFQVRRGHGDPGGQGGSSRGRRRDRTSSPASGVGQPPSRRAGCRAGTVQREALPYLTLLVREPACGRLHRLIRR
jgi:hypothetical protein